MLNDLSKPLKFYYKNWRGEYGYRTVMDPVMWYGSTEFHKEPQWMIKAYDVEKDAVRDFAVNDIVEFIREV